jgi:hypothetical protein
MAACANTGMTATHESRAAAANVLSWHSSGGADGRYIATLFSSEAPAERARHVQAKGAFDETILGILKLKDRGQRVEIRVVLHALTAPIIEDTDRWIARNLPFVDHVALMGLDRRRNREGPQTDIRCT